MGMTSSESSGVFVFIMVWNRQLGSSPGAPVAPALQSSAPVDLEKPYVLPGKPDQRQAGACPRPNLSLPAGQEWQWREHP